MTFPPIIEKWRGTVQAAIKELGKVFFEDFRAIDRAGLTISALVDIVLGLIQKESYGDARAVGDSGNSVGLMQLNYGAGTPQGLGFNGKKEDLFDPFMNIYYGTRYLLKQIARYGDVNKAILAYNAGSYRLTEAGVPINQTYLLDVLNFLRVPVDYFASLNTKKKSSELSSSDSSDTESIVYTKEGDRYTRGMNLVIGGIVGSTLTVLGAALLKGC